MTGQQELTERVKKYDPKFDMSLLKRAYLFSEKAHGGQKRESGAVYFSHPLDIFEMLFHICHLLA